MSRFPAVLVRISRNKLNPRLVRAVSHVQATYKITDNNTRGLKVDIANLVFDQKWEKYIVLDDNENDFISWCNVAEHREVLNDWLLTLRAG